MERRKGFLILPFVGFLLWAGLTGSGWSQSQEEPRQMSETIRARSTVVLVDAVVRDNKGRHVPGLSAEDFEILEDGVAHPVTYVEDVSLSAAEGEEPDGEVPLERSAQGRTGRTPPELLQLAGDSAANQALRGSFTALVFDRLTPTARELAWRSVREYVPEAVDENAKVGVFAIDLALHTLQFFTSDTELVYSAIDRVGGKATSNVERAAATLDSSLQSSIDALAEARQASAPTTVGEPPVNPAGWQPNNVRFDRLERSYLGTATLSALQRMVQAMRELPGKKTIIFFSEGIPLPQRAFSRLWSTIEAARASDVTLYTVDAAGFRVVSTGAGMAAGQVRGTGGTDLGDGNVGRPLMDLFEGLEESLRSDPHYGLKQLAEKTGGFLVRDTNRITDGLQKIDQDLRSYYLLAYTPRNPDFDGRYRRIEVRVRVPDLQLRYRKGYYAVDAAFKEPLLEYEMPAVALLESGETVEKLPVRAAVLNFPRPDDAGFVAILADLAPGALAYRGEDQQEVSNFSIVGLVRDEEGRIVRKVSRLYRLGRESDGSPGGDSILFYQPLRLDPGKYQVEVAAFDSVSGNAGVERIRLEIPEADPTLPGLSSLVIVGDAEEIDSGERAAQTPFFYKDLLFYPNLGDRVSKSRSPELTLYFSVSPAEEKPRQAWVEILHYNRRLGTSEVSLPEPGDQDQIKYVASISLQDYDPGIYTLRVSVPSGDKVVSRSRRFILSR